MKAPSKTGLATLAAGIALAAPAFAALKPGTPAPDCSAPAYLAGEPFTFKLADALEKGPVVVYFFPAAHTPGCNLEAALFAGDRQVQGPPRHRDRRDRRQHRRAGRLFEGNRALRRQVPGG